MKYLFAFLTAGILSSAAALAQPPYSDTECGNWVNDVWVPNGNCTEYVEVYRHSTVSGTIVSVKGHLVTVQQSTRQVIINDRPALDAKQTGKVAVGRVIVAYGYWHLGNFYATAIY